ncbi:MAG: ABC transporter ATP-binding protein [Nanoarchaeota archaeon]
MTHLKPVIQLEDVWKTYQMGEVQVHALRGISLKIMPGEFVAIQGPSGSGKSTAMNLVGCLDTPSRGTVRLDGKDISKLSESALAQIRGRKIGFVFQKFNLIPVLSAIENVMLPMTFIGISRDERYRRAKAQLVALGMFDRLDHRPSQLSGGQQQRVAIARALAIDPQLILADEPTGNLDSTTGKQIMDIFKRLHHDEGKTVVLVTHDDSLARLSRRVERIRDGRLESPMKPNQSQQIKSFKPAAVGLKRF